MKIRHLILGIILSFTSIEGLFAQSTNGNDPIIPLQPKSALFGDDIMIDSQPLNDQRNVAVCSAFNGWLYAVTTSYDSLNHLSNLDLLRSIDGGITWTFLYGGGYPVGFARIHSLGIVAVGDSISNLKVIESGFYTVSTSQFGQGFLY